MTEEGTIPDTQSVYLATVYLYRWLKSTKDNNLYEAPASRGNLACSVPERPPAKEHEAQEAEARLGCHHRSP